MGYSKAQVLEITGVREPLLSRWTDIDIIVPASGGGAKGANREYSFLNLIEVKVAQRLHRVGLHGSAIHEIIHGLKVYWPGYRRPNLPENPVVWVWWSPANRRQERPLVQLTSAESAAVLASKGNCYGILVGLGETIEHLEEATGEKLYLEDHRGPR